MSQPPPPPPPPPDGNNKPPRRPMYIPMSPTGHMDSPSPLHTASVKSSAAAATSPQRSQSTNNHTASSSLEDLLTKDDQAERGLLQSMEDRRSHFQTTGGDAWHASVVGERPPLGGAVPLDRLLPSGGGHERKASFASGSHASRGSRSSGGSQQSATKLADIARRMRQKTAAAATATAGGGHATPSTIGITTTHSHPHPHQESSVTTSISSLDTHSHTHYNSSTATTSHRRAPSRAHALLDSIQEQPEGESDIFDGLGVGGGGDGHNHNDSQTGTSGGGGVVDLDQATTHTDHLLTGAMQVEELFDESLRRLPSSSATPDTFVEEGGDDDDEAARFETEFTPLDERRMSETAPLNAAYSYQHPPASLHSHSNASKNSRHSATTHNHSNHASPMMNAKQMREKAANIKKQSAWWSKLGWACCHPRQLLENLVRFLWFQTWILTGALPCFVLASVFFYGLDNPTWSFLPGHATVSWWLNFGGRQTLLYEASRLWQWCLIDKLVLGTRMAVQCLGPLLTLCFIQARGWPFCVAAWGFLDLLLLEGSSELARHWFWFSGLSMYNQMDSGSYILNSDIYVRLLMSMMLGGIAIAIKRTAVAMYFGRRTFVEFKPRLEKLLKEVVLVSELAALAEEAELAASEELMEVNKGIHEQKTNSVKFLGDVSWSRNHHNTSRRRDGSFPTTPVGSNDDATDSDDDDDDDDSEITTQNDILPESQAFGVRQDSAGSSLLQGLLDHWEEPINKADKSLNASISDILRFRRALTFMDDDLMFGETFGPASTRDQLINSAQSVYNRLLMLTPGRAKVSCEFYDMLALEDNGKINTKKRKALRKLFRPDATNEISLLSFAQSCDSLYKKLRYFRANVGNASVIDHALESIVDGAFGFVLALVLLSVMRINPWPLLVSISTLLVSISFAVGSSASKWFEGTLLVAARRPFDLGDRIYMTDPSLIQSDGLWYCWFVEDINLFHTTVRYAGTNEVATINNGSVANMRIINGARSPNAAVWFQFAYRPNLMEDGNIDKIKAALEGYARDNPHNWHSFGYFRVDEVHPDIEKLVVTIGMQHRSAWQDLVRILEAKALIMCWLMEYSRKLGVLYDELPKRELMYYAGNLKDGGVRQHRFQLHNPTNITSGGFNNMAPQATPGSPTFATNPKTPSDARFLDHLKHSHG